jgi:hypothetical protein
MLHLRFPQSCDPAPRLKIDLLPSFSTASDWNSASHWRGFRLPVSVCLAQRFIQRSVFFTHSFAQVLFAPHPVKHIKSEFVQFVSQSPANAPWQTANSAAKMRRRTFMCVDAEFRADMVSPLSADT